jgi:hypothetical protein
MSRVDCRSARQRAGLGRAIPVGTHPAGRVRRSAVGVGVLRSSVLGPLLFVVYTAELNHHFNLHQCADDCQIYPATPPSQSTTAVRQLADCLADVYSWMGACRLRLNHTKTQIMWLGSKHQLEKVVNKNINALSISLHAVDSACDLGVVLDSQLIWRHTFQWYVRLAIKNCGS